MKMYTWQVQSEIYKLYRVYSKQGDFPNFWKVPPNFKIEGDILYYKDK